VCVEVIVAVDPWGSFDLREGVQPGPALQSLDPESLPLQNGFPVQPFLKIVQISSLVDLRPARRGALHLRDHGILLGARGLLKITSTSMAINHSDRAEVIVSVGVPSGSPLSTRKAPAFPQR
jgi:hypothetical protein